MTALRVELAPCGSQLPPVELPTNCPGCGVGLDYDALRAQCFVCACGHHFRMHADAWLALLPDTHVAIVRADRIVSGMEEALGLVRSEISAMPRALNFISGPSRTGDIEQTIVLGAHGPFRVHLLVVG